MPATNSSAAMLWTAQRAAWPPAGASPHGTTFRAAHSKKASRRCSDRHVASAGRLMRVTADDEDAAVTRVTASHEGCGATAASAPRGAPEAVSETFEPDLGHHRT